MLDFVKFMIAESLTQGFGHLKHLEHLEDHVINDGAVGFAHARKVLDHTHTQVRGGFAPSKLTTKFDGSPSVVFGHHPKTGQFFVASKSAFNKNPKINYTPEDIERNHGHAPGLVAKLKHALEHLPKVAPKKGVYQGDLMYSGDDVVHHDGMYHFTPNTIMYSAHKDSDEGKKINKAKMGIVVHTKYHGHSLESMSAGFDPDLHKFGKHQDVHIIDHHTQIDPKHFTSRHEKLYKEHIKKAEREMAKAHPETFAATAPHQEHLKTYINQTVRTGEKPTPSGYRMHLMNVGERAMSRVSSQKAKDKKRDEMLAMLRHAEEHEDKFHSLFNIHHHLQRAKDQLVDALSKSSNFTHTISGHETKPEGFVSTVDGHPTKLVDRAEFSRANFLKARS